jgi:hypothetical protein
MIKHSKIYLLVLIGVILLLPVHAQVVIQRCDVTTGWKGKSGFFQLTIPTKKKAMRH